MKTTGIILSILGAGLLVTGIVILVKQKKAEKTSGADGGCGCSEEKSNYLDTGGGGSLGGKKGKASLI